LNRVRWFAALLVVLGHVRVHILEASAQFASDAIVWKLLVFASGFGRGAVMIFFVISGYLVGGSLLSKPIQAQTLRRYALDRLTRLYVVLVPVLVLTWLLAYWQCQASQQCFWQQEQWSSKTLMGNLIFQQGIRFQNWGGNYPLWSLANEFLYYLAFPIMLMAYKTDRYYRVFALLALALVLLLMGWQVLVLFPVWLLGIAARLRWLKPIPVQLALLSLIVTLCLKRLYAESAFGLLLDYAIGISFFLWIRAVTENGKQVMATGYLQKFDKWAADWSFTLYAVHVPILVSIAWLISNRLGPLALDTGQPVTWLIYALCLFGTLAGCYLVSLLTEKQTSKVRKLFIEKNHDRFT
jgi:peptidoglycan/LPS O-acetylase OafA/YrhL